MTLIVAKGLVLIIRGKKINFLKISGWPDPLIICWTPSAIRQLNSRTFNGHEKSFDRVDIFEIIEIQLSEYIFPYYPPIMYFFRKYSPLQTFF